MTPNGNEGVGVQTDYLECTYETKYYVVDKVNSQINAIHDDSLELIEFKGCFSPFDLDELEMKVCRLADQNKDEDDIPEPQDALQLIGTMYHNYHRPALIVIFIFPDLLLKILQTSSQERACPTQTYVCLAKHNSNSQ